MSYNKLVRDKIIDIIRANGENPIYHTLSDEEYLAELHKKLIEEAYELIEADDIGEFADVLEVLYTIAKHKNINMEEVEKERVKKREKRGGFEDKIYLEGVEELKR
ncbi:MAG: nucleoside triphosphate pyrophosphohydrolase [Clostridia bacterium]|nr:nucleoside triphosphate pyrophosphohydrolase [Clostridia bacterium]